MLNFELKCNKKYLGCYMHMYIGQSLLQFSSLVCTFTFMHFYVCTYVLYGVKSICEFQGPILVPLYIL